jgi:hypothetical protein
MGHLSEKLLHTQQGIVAFSSSVFHPEGQVTARISKEQGAFCIKIGHFVFGSFSEVLRCPSELGL